MNDLPCERKCNDLMVYIIMLTVCLSNVSGGCVMAWPMTALPMLLSSSSPIALNSSEAAWVTSIVYVGFLASSVVVGLKMNKYGPKRILMASVIPYLVGWTILGLATTYWELLLGRFILGIAITLCHNTAEVYLSELVKARIRGRVCSMCSVSVNVGLVLTFGLGPYFSLSAMAWLNMILPTVFILIMIWAPNSPYWYSKKKKYEDMRKSLIRLRQTENVQAEFDNINSFVENNSSSEKMTCSWRSVRTTFSRRANRRGLFFVIFTSMAQQLSGIQAINSYAQLIFERLNHIIDERYIALLLGLIQLCCSMLSTLVIDKVGRKPLFVVSAMGSASTMLILSIYFHLESIGIDLALVNLIPFCMILLFAFFYGLGLSPVISAIMGDCVPLDVRPMGLSMVLVALCFSCIAVTKLWQVITDNFGDQYAFGCFALITYFNAIVILIFLPETKGKTLAEVQRILEGRQGGRVEDNINPMKEIVSNTEESAMLQNKK